MVAQMNETKFEENVLLNVEEKIPTRSKLGSPPSKLLLTAFLLSFGGPFNFGYQLLITNPSQEAFLSFLNTSTIKIEGLTKTRLQLEETWGVIVSLFFFGGALGAIFIRSLSEKLGRIRALQCSHLLQILACSLHIASFFTVNHFLYSAARILLGFAISISLGVTPMLITESSPGWCRGKVSMIPGILLQSALVVGAVAAMPQLIGTEANWWMLYAGELVLTTLVTALVMLVKESPGYIVSSNRHSDQAIDAVMFYHNVDREKAKFVVEELEERSASMKKHSVTLLSIWKEGANRHGMLVGSLVMSAMVMSGIAAINAFAFEILLTVGLTSLEASIANAFICFMSVVGILCSAVVVDHLGRRPILLWTFALLAIINVFVSVLMFSFESTKEQWCGYSLVIVICIFNLTFAAGPGPVSLFVTGELVEQEARGAACTWANISMGIGRSLLLTIYFPLKNVIGQPMTYFVLFVPPMIISVILLYFHLPESKGKTAKEVQDSVHTLPKMCKSADHGIE